MKRIATLIPGLLLCAVAVAISLFVNSRMPLLSALLVAILLGVVAGNVGLPESTDAGLKFAAKPLLRTGIVLLGLQVSPSAGLPPSRLLATLKKPTRTTWPPRWRWWCSTARS